MRRIARPSMRLLAPTASFVAAAFSAIACQNIAGLGEFTPQGDDVASTTGEGGGDRGGGGNGEGGRGATGGGSGDGGSGGEPSPTSSSTVTSTTTSTGGGCTLDHLVISEVRTRGPDGGNQDFIEIFNATTAPITLGADHHIDARGEDSGNYGERWRGDGTITIPAGGRALLANEEDDNPLGGAEPDDVYQSGIPDGASVVLYEGETVVDAVCFTCEGQLDEDYVCEGTPLSRGATCGDDGDASVQRRPEGGVDSCTDTDENATDLDEGPSTPEGTD
jgi:hypothetical protein